MQRLSIGPFLSFSLFEGTWSICITPSSTNQSPHPRTPLPSFLFVFFVLCRVLGMFSPATLPPLSLIRLPKLTVYQKSFFIYSPLIIPFYPVIFPPLSCFQMRTGLYSVTVPSLRYPLGSFHLFFFLSFLSTLNAFCCMCINFFGPFLHILKFLKPRAFTLLCHRDYIPPKHVVPTVWCYMHFNSFQDVGIYIRWSNKRVT